MGVRRAGKTLLTEQLTNQVFDCELPRVRRLFEDPEVFFKTQAPGALIGIDEIHRLENPSEVLKIAADHFPSIRVIATGSSTLSARRKFKDTLTGRKHDVLLTPMASADLRAFGNKDLEHRLFHGGLPPFFLGAKFPEAAVAEWLDGFWAKDVQELFGIENRAAFYRMLELLFARSGAIQEAQDLGQQSGVSHTTSANYLSAMEQLLVIHAVRPFAKTKANEIIRAPRYYGFDTGFVTYFKGWGELRNEDKGVLWEHLVLNEFLSVTGRQLLRYWRTKQGAEIDFVLVPRGESAPIAIECKWQERHFDPSATAQFRDRYPDGENLVICSDVPKPLKRRIRNLDFQFLNLAHIGPYLEKVPLPLTA